MPRAPLRLYVEIGLIENFGCPSMLDVNRHVRDVLQAKGYEYRYVEFNGRHDFASWQKTLGEGLIHLLGRSKK